mgnify:CR=1 FL=1
MKIKHHTSQLQDIKPGDIKDNSQYISMYFENSKKKVKELFTCSLKDGSEYTGRLFGRSEVIDAEGNEISDCKVYLDILKKKKTHLVHNNRLAGIELVDKDEKVFNIFTSMNDCFEYLKSKEK